MAKYILNPRSILISRVDSFKPKLIDKSGINQRINWNKN